MIYHKEENEPLMCLKSPGAIETVSRTFDELEKRIGRIKGRKFYGLSREVNGSEEYLACAGIEAEDEPAKIGLDLVTLPAGKYDRELLKNWASKWDGRNIEGLHELFQSMAGRNAGKIDSERYTVEYYRSQKELYIMIPLK